MEEITEMPTAGSGGGKKTAGRTKKEKKPIQVVAVVTPDGIEGTFTPEPRKPLIVHLPFQSTEVEFSSGGEIRYDPNPPPQPEPYDTEDQAYFQVNTENSSNENQIGVEQEGWKLPIELINTKESTTTSTTTTTSATATTTGTATTTRTSSSSPPIPSQPVPVVQEKVKIHETSKLLLCYKTKIGETFKTPEKTDVACFWCTEKPRNSPCFSPVKEEGGIYHVEGNYCTPQCVIAHLLSQHLDSHVRWERISLVHRMYNAGSRLYPAPPRESLQKFGGPYTYDQYLEIIGSQRVRVDIQTPPLVSILGTLDTKPIDFYDSSLQNTFTGGFSLDRFKAWSEQGGALRLKRSKPLKDRESTLDSIISIRRPGEVSVSFNTA